MKETVWVTGAAGFSGRYMIDFFQNLRSRPRVVGVDIIRPDNTKADLFLEVDLCDKDSVAKAVQEETPNIVIHLAGIMPPNAEPDMYEANVLVSRILADTLASYRSRDIRLLSIGSAAEYGNFVGKAREDAACSPTSAYGRTKHEQTTSVLAFNSPNLQVVVARPFNLLGPGLSSDLVAGRLCRQFVENGLEHGYIRLLGPTDSVRDFVDVRDAVSAYWILAKSGTAGQIYNVCAGVGTSIMKLIQIMQEAFGVEVEIKSKSASFTTKPDVSIGENNKLVSLGWRANYSLEASVRAMVNAARNY